MTRRFEVQTVRGFNSQTLSEVSHTPFNQPRTGCFGRCPLRATDMASAASSARRKRTVHDDEPPLFAPLSNYPSGLEARSGERPWPQGRQERSVYALLHHAAISVVSCHRPTILLHGLFDALLSRSIRSFTDLIELVGGSTCSTNRCRIAVLAGPALVLFFS
jgi:hypothetical protein